MTGVYIELLHYYVNVLGGNKKLHTSLSCEYEECKQGTMSYYVNMIGYDGSKPLK